MRRFLVLPLALLALLVTAPTASADKPLRFPAEGPSTLVLSGICSFDVQLDVLVNTQKVMVFSDGRTIVNGNFVVRATNLANRANSIVLESSGPLFFTPNDDGTTNVRGTGTNIWYFFPGQIAPGSPGAVYLVRGLSTEIVDASGVPITGTFHHSGYIEDLCVTLA
jgi:hypothetical protein